MKRSIRLAVLSPIFILVAGCAGTPKQATNDAEYEWVRPTGSNIAVKVKKGEAAAVTTSPVGSITGEQASSIYNSAGGKVPTDKGGP